MTDIVMQKSAPARDVGFLVAGRLISALAQSFIVVWLVAVDSPEQVGFLLSWFSIALIASGLTDFGFTTLILVSTKSSWEKTRSLLGADTLISAVLAAVVVVASVLAVLLNSERSFVICVVNAATLLIWGILETLTEAANMVQLGRGQSSRAGLAIALRRLIALGVFALLVGTGLTDIAFSVALFSGTAAVYVFLPKAWATRGVFTRELFDEIRPYAVMSGVGQLRNFDVPIMAAVFGPGRSAPYAVGARLANPVLILAGSLGNVLVASRQRLGRSHLVTILIIGSGLTAAVICLGPFIAPPISVLVQPEVAWLTDQNVLVAIVVFARFLLVAMTMVLSGLLVSLSRVSFTARVNLVFALTASLVLVLVGVLSNQVLLTLFASILIYLCQAVTLAAVALRDLRRGGPRD